MPERHVTVASADGLHARPAALFVKAATDAGVNVTIGKAGAGRQAGSDGQAGTGGHADARSILAVLALDVRHGDEVVLQADGDNADVALDKLAAMLQDEHV